MQRNSNGYIIGFAAAVCIVCALFVSGSAVALKETQQKNQKLDLQKNVISVSALPEAQKLSSLTESEIVGLFGDASKPIASKSCMSNWRPVKSLPQQTLIRPH